jgi:hypothetical protein
MSRVSAHHDTEACGTAPLTATSTSTTHRYSSLSLHLSTPLTLTTIVSTKDKRFVALLLSWGKPNHLWFISLPRILHLRKPASLCNLTVPSCLSLLYLLLGLSSTLHHGIHSWLLSGFTADFTTLLQKKLFWITSTKLIVIYLDECTLRIRFACC